MRKPDFQFKQFSIWHDQCAMKVNTDGILLGAWSQLHSAQNIADIGTGTGLIALMLAQKDHDYGCIKKASITAIEIDPKAAQQASFNVEQSPWHKQVNIVELSFQQYAEQSNERFELLVSNPPYFTNSLKAPDKSRDTARHNDSLSFSDLLTSAQTIATEDAHFYLILPCEEADKLLSIAGQHGWFLSHHCLVSTVTDKQATRSLLQLTNQEVSSVKTSNITIRDRNNNYTQEFVELCRDYYLFM